ncbi:MAG: hypothetical protein N2745_07340 [Syntrophorhabdaceae bacterium]|nr:hypothetical protein [Syntrophorhabdaceae bacterium]
MADYDDERPNWREIDRKKDRSRHYGRQDKTEKKDLPKDRWNMARRKEALDRLFMGDKGTVEHDRAYNRIHKTYGTASFATNVKRYIEKYGLPDDVSTLLLCLDTKEKEVVLPVMDKLALVYKASTPREKEDIKRKLSIIKMTDKSIEIREKAEEVLHLIFA